MFLSISMAAIPICPRTFIEYVLIRQANVHLVRVFTGYFGPARAFVEDLWHSLEQNLRWVPLSTLSLTM